MQKINDKIGRRPLQRTSACGNPREAAIGQSVFPKSTKEQILYQEKQQVHVATSPIEVEQNEVEDAWAAWAATHPRWSLGENSY